MRGTLFRRERLVVRWTAPDAAPDEPDPEVTEVTLYRTRGAESQAEIVESLAAEPLLEGVDVSVASPPTVRSRLGEGLG